jgi:excisionase family DNA binding protein
MTAPAPESTGHEKRAFSAYEVAKMLGVHFRTVYNMAERGELGHVRAGQQYVFYRSHLRELAGSEEVLNDMLAALDDGE